MIFLIKWYWKQQQTPTVNNDSWATDVFVAQVPQVSKALAS